MRIYLAPMEGVVDHNLRHILTRLGGVDLCTTEFVRVTEHTLPRKVFTRYCPELLRDNCQTIPLSQVPVRVQLLGSNPQTLASNALKAAQLGAPGVDLNFGCPAKTVNKNRGGACLLDDTALIRDIVSAVRSAVPPQVPVSVKIRLGFHQRDSGLRNALAIAEAGANELVVHARSKADAYQPPAYWDEIKCINQALDIPVIANGEIWSVDDYYRCREQSTCENVMLGRGLLACPDLALRIKASVARQDHCALSWESVRELLFDFFLLTRDQYPKKYLGNRVKQWLHYLKRNYPQANELFENIKRVREEAVLFEALQVRRAA